MPDRYCVQAILGDRVLHESWHPTREAARREARRERRDPTSEADRVRIMTLDGEPVR